MIPVRLRLRNFMSYGENVPALDFGRIRIACLCGDNGHGKSALLDAITWSLWGRARISDRRDASEDELIHMGKSDMEVEFEFELDGVRYLVLRKRAVRVTARRRTSSGVLELQVADGAVYRPLTGDSMSATQRRINDLLKLDYKTFVNSSFILQGRADEFTRKTADERKRILSDLLDLSYYDRLEERARGEARRHETERQEHVSAIAEMDRELAREPEYREEVARLTREIEQLDAEVKRQDDEVARLRAELDELERKATRRTEVLARIERGEAGLAGLRGQLEQARVALAGHQALVERAESIRAKQRGATAAQEELADLDTTFQRLHELTTRRAKLAEIVALAKGKIESDLRVEEQEVKRLQTVVSSEARLNGQERHLRKQLAELTPLPAEREDVTRQAEESRAQAGTLAETNRRIKDEGSLVKERLDLLAQAGATCPVCGGELDAAGRDRLKAQFQAARDRLAGEYQENARRARELEAAADTARRRVQAIDQTLRPRQDLERSHATVEQGLREVEQAKQDHSGAEGRRSALAGRLSARDFARDEQGELAHVETAMAGLGYDEQRHEAVRARSRELTGSEAELANLVQAEAALPKERDRISDLTSLEEKALASTQDDRARLAELDLELEARPDVERRQKQARADLAESQARHGAAREGRGAAQQKLSYCEQTLRAERARREDSRVRAGHEKGLYDELALAFGKNGIQAMIIESVIPEIEREANTVLSRMTDGRLNVKIETQRDARSGGGTIETLDIRISDELGVRNLELYSGGEAFRVNFAIRIGLSKLLAHRAGARVQLLVVDEGFGTQDTFGRQRLIEAINAVAGDFEKIIAITHIDELKDAFPTRIDVVKGPEGSQYTVN